MTTENRCKPSPDGLFHCDVAWGKEAGPETCTYFVHDAFLWSRCGHFAVGHCLSGRANAEAAMLQLQNSDDEPIDAVLEALNKLFWITVEEERTKKEKGDTDDE
jgi:hypothetical protein